MEIVVRSSAETLRHHTEVRTTYDCTVTNKVCSEVLHDIQEAAQLVGSRFLGVDFITLNASLPFVKTGGKINEANTNPGLHHHYDRQIDPYPTPTKDVLRALFPELE